MIATARERVHAMEALAAIIAHELRSGVLGVTSAAQLLRFSVPPDPVVEKSLGRILQEAERLSALHEALTEYATELPPRMTAANPDSQWTQVIREMRGALEAKGVRVTHAPAGARKGLIDPEQLSRALERVIHHSLNRVQSNTELDVVSSTEDDWWTSTISARGASTVSKSDSDRPTFLLVLAQRAVVAHGGELTNHPSGDAPLLITIRLPLSLQAE